MDKAPGTTALDWGARYQSGDTPWDVGGPHPEFLRRRDLLVPPRPGARALVPGCGRGHDALLLAQLGWRVTAVDLVESLAHEVGPRLAAAGVDLRIRDALSLVPDDLGGPVDLFLEHTFLCAVPLDLRPAWGRLVERVLAPTGRLVALVFPADKPAAEGGPPFRLTPDDVALHLGSGFQATFAAPVGAPLARRNWAEYLALFERTRT
ncbi:MAG: methyltransferase domain-containing protein [Planctomycetaceae bacterium]|nr:methyltransferase domain-containing protein [Planctomycetaceae bacterium]